jgi:uncharacterized protein (DUF1800 family)
MAQVAPLVAHLLRRAGFGVGADEQRMFAGVSYVAAVDALINYSPDETDVDSVIGVPGYVGITTRGQFSPNTVINDARQRWLVRMVHSPTPLAERMALIWHHHFATAYSKINGTIGGGAGYATRMMDAKPSTDSGGVMGQIELFRQRALGNFRDLLVEVAKDPAMLVWLDGRLNTRTRPQENFGRELMELFTIGVGNHTEEDVYAAARVFTGWNLGLIGTRDSPQSYYVFSYVANQHDTAAKDFSFPIYANGSKRIEARSAANGMQDGLDLIAALAIHPETAKRMARRLWTWFVSETESAPDDFVDAIAKVYLDNDTNMKPVIRAVLLSRHFLDPARRFQRYGWPVEFVVRSLKEIGFVGFSVDSAITPLLNMGQQLYEPPDVNGWDLGAGWFSTGGMLARMNFAAALSTNQRFALRELARPHRESPDKLVDFVVSTMSLPPLDPSVRSNLIDYVNAGGAWTGSDTQLLAKSAGLFHLMGGSGPYQLM